MPTEGVAGEAATNWGTWGSTSSRRRPRQLPLAFVRDRIEPAAELSQLSRTEEAERAEMIKPLKKALSSSGILIAPMRETPGAKEETIV
jgi:hypothetical protein